MTVVVVRIPGALLFFGACLAGVTFSLTTRHLEAADEHGWRILFDSLRGGKREIYVMDTNGGNLHNVSNHPANDSFPAWFDSQSGHAVSPVGKRTLTWGWLKTVGLSDVLRQTPRRN